MNDPWYLRPAGADDLDALLALACQPPVYRYLFDGAAPERAELAGLIAASVALPAEAGAGLSLLSGGRPGCAGVVELRPDFPARCAELIYLLDPAVWRRGLALRMAWSAICRAFGSGRFDTVVAVADLPNVASIALMHRLGMRYRRPLEFPLGPGVEYALSRDDAGPQPRPAVIPFR